MSAYLRDLLTRVLFTASASGLGVVITDSQHWSYWWAAAFGALLTGVRSVFVSHPSKSVVERTLWTAAQTALGALPVALFGLPLALIPVASGVLAAAKGWVAKKIGDPNTAELLRFPSYSLP